MATIASPISSTSDMMAAVPADLFDGISAAPEPVEDDSPVEAEPVDNTIEVAEPAEDEPAVDEPVDEVAGETSDAEPVAAKDPATEDELPEGVRKGQDRKGKAGYFLEENRYQTFHGNHKLVQEGARIIGEPLTAEALSLRNEAFLAQERLFTNLTSGDPALQGDVVKFIVNEMASALEKGEVGTDPTVPFAETIFSTLQAQAPAAFEHLQLQSARALVDQMYALAAQKNDGQLFGSAQRVVMALADVEPKPSYMTDEQYAEYVGEAAAAKGLSWHTMSAMQDLARTEDPTAKLQRENAELKAQLNGRSKTSTAEQYDGWARKNVADVNAAILNDAVKPSLASVEAGWKSFPDDYKRLVVDPLHREVIKAVRADQGFNQLVVSLQARAERATSEQVRAQLGAQIKQLFVNRAIQAAESQKTPIVKFAADWLKGRSDQTHERRNNAQTRTTPKGPGAPVNPSLLPSNVGFKDGIFDSATAVKQMQALLR